MVDDDIAASRTPLELDDGMPIIDAPEKFVTGKSTVRRVACVQALQAISDVDFDTLTEVLMWARAQIC